MINSIKIRNMINKIMICVLFSVSFSSMSLISCNNSNSEKNILPKDSILNAIENNKVYHEIDYTGTYTIVDKTSCDISITITKKGNDLTYKSGEIEGKVEIIQQDKETYLNFSGFTGKSPEGDLEAKYENETLYIQNEGNAMNPYTRLKQCDTKFLELKKSK